jgi:hypothetical protein
MNYGLCAGTKLVVVFLVFPVILSACYASQYNSVPGDAKPSGFKKLASWDSCGATGARCSQVIVFGSDAISFDDAVGRVEARYLKRGWHTATIAPNDWSDGGMVFSDPANRTCVQLWRFNVVKYRHPEWDAPSTEAMAKIVASYATVIEATAGCA